MHKKPVLITGYVNPDLDAYACAVGYAELWQKMGREAVGGCYGEPLDEVKYVLSLVGESQVLDYAVENYSAYIVVDTSDPYHLPAGLPTSQVEEVVDHHLYNDLTLFPNARLDIQAVGAAATLIVERFQNHGHQPSRSTAALLYGAIISNTLNFQAKVSTERDSKAAQWLLPLAELPQDFIHSLFTVKSNVAGDRLLELLRLDMSGSETDGKIYTIGQLEMVGVPELLSTRVAELQQFMAELHDAQHAYVTFLSLSDVELGKTYFITPLPETRQILESTLHIQFKNGIGEYPELILRKEYVPIVKQFATT